MTVSTEGVPVPIDPQLTRRTALAVGTGAVGALTLAACGASGSTTAPRAAAPAQTKTAPGGDPLVRLEDITVGEAIAAKLPDGSPVLVARPSESTAACFSAICTHQGCTVAPAGKELHCPCHGSKYDAITGAVIHGPAPRALAKVAVHVAAGEVVTG